ncbi:hypothetical protein [Streptomyces olivochromogenes]|uniref:Uncharacterized protein n=1 Tax=Streptomyces olivochromogenes TaxID=1963 RepID=A0A250VL12_STROL|nr:hypothetical protein [Streptomyces olivochromogenes]KUN44117.1 hypothetical protein AQJ27_28910 [Streptomyces olivochromogenes]GAX54897.1 hypothetical protein SO3561_06450 [Streptomyces olivochromogenes]
MHERPLSVQVGSAGFGPFLKVEARPAGERTAGAFSGDIDTEHRLQRSLREAPVRSIGGPPTAVTGIPARTTQRTRRMG